VIIGPDLTVEDGELVTRGEARSSQDSSIRGYKNRFRSDPRGAREAARRIVLNTYRTLMTRGLKGCYVYAVDPSLQECLREAVGESGRAG
jgi:uncharacterized protein